MNKFLLLSFTALTALSSTANAQEMMGMEWDGRINVGGFITDGNTNKKAAVIDGIAKATGGENRYTVGAELRYAEDEGVETEDEYKIYGAYDRFLSEKMFTGARVQYESDDIANLDSRIKVGPYIGYQYYKSEGLNLATTLGVDYVADEFENGDREEDAAASWGVDYDQKLVDDTIQVFYKHDMSVPFKSTEGFLFDSEAGVRFPIAKVLTGTAQIDFDWDNDPAAGVDENDTKYSLKLGYEF